MASKISRCQTTINYDLEGDVLNSTSEPMAADCADSTDEGIVVRLREGKIVGLTILNAQQRLYSAS